MPDCIFCKIVAGEIPSTKVHEDDEVLAFRDINPKAPTHILVIPKKHIEKVSDLSESDQALAGRIILAGTKIAASEGLSDGYRLVFNCGPLGGQDVYHIHLHVLGGRQMTWPPGD